MSLYFVLFRNLSTDEKDANEIGSSDDVSPKELETNKAKRYVGIGRNKNA